MMKRILPLVTGALIALGATVAIPSLASAASPPRTCCTSQSFRYNIVGAHVVEVFLYRSDGTMAGYVRITVSNTTNHLGQHQKDLFIDNLGGQSIQLQVRAAGGNTVTYHASAPGANFRRDVYYTISNFRLMLGSEFTSATSYVSPWFGQP